MSGSHLQGDRAIWAQCQGSNLGVEKATQPRGPSSPSLSLAICNTPGGRLLLLVLVACDSEEVAALFLFCSCEKSSEWFMAKAFTFLYLSLNLSLDSCPFSYGFHWELTSQITSCKPTEKKTQMFHSIFFSKEKLLFLHLQKKKSSFNH